MPAPVDHQGSPAQSSGQQRKLGTASPAETATTDPVAGSTIRTGTTDAPPGTAAPARSALASATAVAPIPERLRDLIALHSRSDAPALTELHGLARRLEDSQAWTAQIGLAPAAVQRTAAEIIAQPPESIRVQATQTRDGVRALLRLEG